MTWIIRTLAGAVIAGLGWKLGSDAYEEIKRRLRKRGEEPAADGAEDGGGATQTEVVELAENRPSEGEA